MIVCSVGAVKPATPQEIVAGSKSCIAATTAKSVDPAKLRADGWNTASVSNDGRAIETPMTFFGKGGLLLTFNKQRSAPFCFITAHLPAAANFDAVAFAMDGGLGIAGKAKPSEAGTIYWFPTSYIVQLTATGTLKEPAVRVAIGYRL